MNNVTRMKIRAQAAPWRRGVELCAMSTDGQSFVKEVVMQKADSGLAFEPPVWALSMEAGQALIDDLWACGLRPTEGAGSAGALHATERHLEDMRKIAFAAIKLGGPST